MLKFPFLPVLSCLFFFSLIACSEENQIPPAANNLNALAAPSAASENTFKGFIGKLELSPQEVLSHIKNIDHFTQAAAFCLQWHLDQHRKLWDQYHISAFYGNRSEFSTMSLEQKQAKLERMHIPAEVAADLKPISCVDLTITCLKYSFENTDQAATWQKINKFTVDNDKDGTALQIALQQLGWKVLYWNPDVNLAKDWDKEETTAYPDNKYHFWGYHAERLNQVMNKQKYLYNPVDDASTLVNFGRRLPFKFRKVPFFVGTAHTGFHVFPGYQGYVIEAHSTARITEEKTIEAGYLDPLSEDAPHPNAGGYGTYRSGLIAVPPGYGF